MRTILLVIAVLAVIAIVALRTRSWLPPTPQPIVIQSQGPTVERLQRLSHLVTTKVLIADVLVGEGEGHVGAWLIKGDALIGVDLSRAKITTKDNAAKASDDLPTATRTTDLACRSFPDANLGGPEDHLGTLERRRRQVEGSGDARSPEADCPSRHIERVHYPVESCRGGNHCGVL